MPVRVLAALCLLAPCLFAATFGTVTTVVGGVADLVLDEGRGRLYLVNTTRNRIEVYSTAQRRFLNPIATEDLPIAAAMSRNGRILYVTVHTASALMAIDLDTQTVARRINLPARPEGVAVGYDERVLISTVGSGTGNLQNVLLIYDPAASEDARALSTVPIAPPPPQDPQLPAVAGRPFLASRSQLQATPDGRFIIGVNIPAQPANSRAVFVYEAASGIVLRSRTVNGISSVLSVSPDGARFMAGLTMFETATLVVIAQQNAANSPYPFPNGTNFNVQQNQGGSVFTPDGARLYSAFNVAPVQTPAAPANVSQLMINDPENLLIQTALQLPENLTGKMVLTGDGGNAYALSDSGFLTLPFSNMNQSPIAAVESNVVLLANDQCDTSRQRIGGVAVRNEGRGRLTAQAALLQTTPAGPGALGGAAGPGGGAPGGAVVIVVPPIDPATGRPVAQPAPALPAGQQTPTNNAIVSTAPAVRSTATADGSQIQFTYNTSASRAMGTISPTHQFLVQSNEAINIPSAVRVFQNNRNTESRGDILPVPVGLSANEALTDLALDGARQRLYIANSGKNRVEVYDTRERRFLEPLKAGQLPRSVALTPDGGTLYVAASGGEAITIFDAETRQRIGEVKFPPLPFNANVVTITPTVIAATQRGLMIVMSNGTIWKVVGNEAVPRRLPPAIFGTQTTVAAPRTLASSPNGDFALLVAGNGMGYLYDAAADEFVQSRQVAAANATGYIGPVAVGPRGQYFAVGGQVLNQALVPVSPAGTQQAARPVSAVAAVGPASFARFVQPALANANALPATFPTIEIADANTLATVRSAQSLEGPITPAVANMRLPVDGRTLAIDPSGTVAYALTVSGLSVIPLDPVSAADRPAVNNGGTVNVANYTPSIAMNGLISIFGRNLAGETATPSSTPLPAALGGACVTLNDRPIPLLLASPGQINAQIPPNLAAGNYQMAVRLTDRKLTSPNVPVRVNRYAPAVLVDPASGQPAILHGAGGFVTESNPARRDRPLVMYAIGLGPPRTGSVSEGNPSPASPLAETERVQVHFGDPRIRESEVIVDWAGLVPGYIGLYQLNLRVPGAHVSGDRLPVTLRIGGVDSPTTGQLAPFVAVD